MTWFVVRMVIFGVTTFAFVEVMLTSPIQRQRPTRQRRSRSVQG